ncbi:MAG: hypothetical protein WC730_01060 [Patescibacteria group bacterium]|jgi:hypothetical protein
MSDAKTPGGKWYVELLERFNTLMERLGIPNDVSGEMKTFILGVAREQYMAGNRSGIRWARQGGASSPSYS